LVSVQTVRLNNGTFGADEVYSGGEPIPAGGIESKIEITRQELNEHNVEALEHITVKVWIEHKVRGDVEVEIVSPNGIKSILGGARSADLDSKWLSRLDIHVFEALVRLHLLHLLFLY
jgi:kexin